MDADMIPSSPSSTETSSSSSDIATESTGSFFRDRSTTLGTLMGVTFADGEQEQGHDQAGRDAGEEAERPHATVQEAEGWRWRQRWRRRRGRSVRGGGWWRLCRDDVIRVPTSLGQFLDMERQLSDAGLLCRGGAGESVTMAVASPFGNGRARPTAAVAAAEAAVGVAGQGRGRWKPRRRPPAAQAQESSSSSLARLPVLLTAICSGGAG